VQRKTDRYEIFPICCGSFFGARVCSICHPVCLPSSHLNAASITGFRAEDLSKDANSRTLDRFSLLTKDRFSSSKANCQGVGRRGGEGAKLLPPIQPLRSELKARSRRPFVPRSICLYDIISVVTLFLLPATSKPPAPNHKPVHLRTYAKLHSLVPACELRHRDSLHCTLQ